jgi:hypothetical protein
MLHRCSSPGENKGNSHINSINHGACLLLFILDYRPGGPGSIPGTTRKKKLVSLELGPLSLVSTTEELIDRKVAAPVYKTENTAVGIRPADHVAPSISKKLAITSPTSGGRSAGVVGSRTQTMEFSFGLACLFIRLFIT